MNGTDVCVLVRSAGGEGPAESDQTETGDRPDGREDRRGRAHPPAGQAQREVQHDARHARHQHPGDKRLVLNFLTYYFMIMNTK